MTTTSYRVSNGLFLWWLADPEAPVFVGSLRHVQRKGRQAAGVSLEYAESWLARGPALSDDLPLQRGEFLPVETDAASRRRG
ncbi:MAG TPA: hypothetical protein VGM81_14365 [Burkholderiaceae bacterium]|jgi:serine/threonine-protein kinase HipA